MIDEPAARERGKAEFDSPDNVVVLGHARELATGWLFPVISKNHDLYSGVIVNKETGASIRVMSGSPLDADPTLYERGYQFDVYDVVVLSIADMERAVQTILALHHVTTDVYYRYGRVYRVGRGLTEAEVRERLSLLPAVFTGRLTFHVADFEEAREKGWFEFKLFEYRPKT